MISACRHIHAHAQPKLYPPLQYIKAFAVKSGSQQGTVRGWITPALLACVVREGIENQHSENEHERNDSPSAPHHSLHSTA